MPEILEIEMYRRGAASVVGRTIVGIDAPDAWYLKNTDARTLRDVLVGSRVESIDRIGKLLMVETTAAVCGLRFGMTGRLVVDGVAVIEKLEYSSYRLEPDWNRFGLSFGDGTGLVMNDPRRLGGVSLDPDTDRLGIDAWTINREQLARLARSTTRVKALLLDQSKIAGLGNLLTDELLWRCAIAPSRRALDLREEDLDTVAATLEPMLVELFDRGGSHCGDLFAERGAGGLCPRDGFGLSHSTVAGRSTWWCAEHQH